MKTLWVSGYDRPGNHVPKVMQAMRRNPPKRGTVNIVHIAHDDWCNLLAGRGTCNCNPDVEIAPATEARQ